MVKRTGETSRCSSMNMSSIGDLMEIIDKEIKNEYKDTDVDTVHVPTR